MNIVCHSEAASQRVWLQLGFRFAIRLVPTWEHPARLSHCRAFSLVWNRENLSVPSLGRRDLIFGVTLRDLCLLFAQSQIAKGLANTVAGC